MRDSTTCCSVSFTEGQSLVVGQESALAICQLSVLLGVDNVGVVQSQLLQTQASSQNSQTHRAFDSRYSIGSQCSRMSLHYQLLMWTRHNQTACLQKLLG